MFLVAVTIFDEKIGITYQWQLETTLILMAWILAIRQGDFNACKILSFLILEKLFKRCRTYV
jgi:hypothetical protein